MRVHGRAVRFAADGSQVRLAAVTGPRSILLCAPSMFSVGSMRGSSIKMIGNCARSAQVTSKCSCSATCVYYRRFRHWSFAPEWLSGFRFVFEPRGLGRPRLLQWDQQQCFYLAGWQMSLWLAISYTYIIYNYFVSFVEWIHLLIIIYSS